MSKNKLTRNSRSADEQLSLDQIYHLLADPRRRYVLYYLYRYENPVRLPDVADQVTHWEQDSPSLPEDRLETYNTLYHCHVPKLAAASVVTYSQDEDMIELAANAHQLRPYLEQAAERDLTVEDTGRL